MKFAIFGAHATSWRGLCNALASLGHRVVCFEHDSAYRADTSAWCGLAGEQLVLYDPWEAVARSAARELHDSDVAVVTSRCPNALHARDAIAAAALPISVFHDLDTPTTLDRVRRGDGVPYIDGAGLGGYDLVLSCAGGAALEVLRAHYGARCVRALYGHVDPDLYQPVQCEQRFAADLSWLGSYVPDRQPVLQELFVEPARRAPECSFLLACSQYPRNLARSDNIRFARYVPPEHRAEFFCSSRLTLNVTRESAACMGWCPARRLFEAAACGATIISDEWSGLDDFYEPGEQILLARSAEDVLDALSLDSTTLRRIGRAARERTLAQHTSEHRARLLLRFVEEAASTGMQVPRRGAAPVRHAIARV